jgi:hypothetical protein
VRDISIKEHLTARIDGANESADRIKQLQIAKDNKEMRKHITS